MSKRPAVLVKRYNANQTLSILARGRVQITFKLGDHSSADHFAKGWFGDHPVRWGRAQFRRSSKPIQERF
jgi:hypothetical protein